MNFSVDDLLRCLVGATVCWSKLRKELNGARGAEDDEGVAEAFLVNATCTGEG